MAKKRKKSNEVKVRLDDPTYARLEMMAKKRNITITSLATTYVTRGLEKEEKEGSLSSDERGADSAE